MLCYTAEVSIDLDKHQEFKEALDSQEFMVEVNLGFKDKEGNILEEVFDKNYSFHLSLLKMNSLSNGKYRRTCQNP